MRIRTSGAVVIALASGLLGFSGRATTLAQTEQIPTFEIDRSWPKPLPNHWEFGYVMAVAVDRRDHVFILHSIQDDYGQPIPDPTQANESLKISGWYERRKKPGVLVAPAVVEFDAEGNAVHGWGGAGHGHPWPVAGPEKVFADHSLNVDPKGNVWITGGNLALKFSPEGKFLMQIGQVDKTNGSNDPRYLGGASSVAFDAKANEVYIADGYINKRIIVYDMDTGAFKRLWGRYGKKPDDSFEKSKEPVSLFGPRFVHDVKLSNDGIVYGIDLHRKIWVFRPDGTFVREVPTPRRFSAVAFSLDPQQYDSYAAALEEDNSPKIYIYRRSDLTQLGSFESASQHYLAVDSKGNLYTTGLSMPQRFVLKTMPKR